MAFDDVARNMASRSRKKLSKATTADAMVAEAAVAGRKMARQRDLILGPILLLIGVIAGGAWFVIKTAPPDPRASYTDHANAWKALIALGALALGALGVGARQTLRGLRNRSHLESDGDHALDVLGAATGYSTRR